MRTMNAAIRTLASDAHDAIVRHLTSLSAEDRFLRFGAVLDNDAIWRYTATIDFGRDKVFGVFEEERLVGVAHLRREWRRDSAWAGISVAPGSRCRGYGYALMCVAALEARRCERRRLALPGLAENHIMLHLARKAGLSVIGELGRSGAYVLLGEPEAVPQRAPAGRRARSLLVGLLLPIFGFDMALMIAASAACDSCKAPQVTAAVR